MFKILEENKKELKALYSGIYALKHRHLDNTEIEKIRSCLTMNFKILDKNHVPFEVQNKTIQLAEKGIDFTELTKGTGILFV